jgi:hypothetical protein
MNTTEDTRWKNLLATGAPAFAGDAEPPYGFITRTLARLREENRQRDLMERIGLRALFASLAVLAAAAILNVLVDHSVRGDLEPGLRGIVQVENVPLS